MLFNFDAFLFNGSYYPRELKNASIERFKYKLTLDRNEERSSSKFLTFMFKFQVLFRCVCSQGDIILTHIFYFRCRFSFQLSYILSSYHKNCMQSQIECEFSMTMRGLTNTHRYVQANSPHIIIKYTTHMRSGLYA